MDFQITKDQTGTCILVLKGSSSVSSLGLKNGEILYTFYKEQEPIIPVKQRIYVTHHPLDDHLLKQPGTITRKRNPQL